MNELVVVGGLVPSLLIDQDNLPAEAERHAGTMDLDIGLKFAMVDEERYTEVAKRLRNAGFLPDVNRKGHPSRQRWRISEPPVTVDFLVEPEPGDESNAGRLFSLTDEWAAIIAPGLHLAFKNHKIVTLEGRTIAGEAARRDIHVCGAGAFVVLKALAFRLRGENKDAYDLFYLLRNYGSGIPDVAEQLRPFLSDPSAKKALEYLRSDFGSLDSVGAMRVAEFLFGKSNPETQADVVGFVRQLLDCL